MVDVPVRNYVDWLTDADTYEKLLNNLTEFYQATGADTLNRFVITPATQVWENVIVPQVIRPVTEFLRSLTT